MNDAEFVPYVFEATNSGRTPGVLPEQSPHDRKAVRKFEDSPSPDSILPFLQLKSIRQVAGPNSITNGGCDEHMNDEDIKDLISRVTHLSFLPESDIQIPPVFPWPHTFLIRPLERGGFIPPEVRRGLLHSKDSLRELTLVDGGGEYEQAGENEEGTSTHACEQTGPSTGISTRVSTTTSA
jgi:hypothetical protein